MLFQWQLLRQYRFKIALLRTLVLCQPPSSAVGIKGLFFTPHHVCQVGQGTELIPKPRVVHFPWIWALEVPVK